MQPKNTLRSQCTGLDELHELAVQSIEAHLLGTMILYGSDPRFKGDDPFFETVRHHVNAGSFGSTTHRFIFMALERIYNVDGVIDVVTLAEELERAGDSVPLALLGEIVRDSPRGFAVRAETYCKIIKAYGELRAENVGTGPQRRRKMKFREVMDKELAHGSVWLTNEVEWTFGESQGEHICYAYFEAP